ncbi:G-protein beta WD-40 repeats containing protein [Reticulomyxa filosa]|uniref:G-protein beta WD-40 repeats containing protein n=1 Tax=Reticulomyxa filosa TaxID=46433 RepID=X6M4E0_RETFI|nr:G-protein beta WD-40 repeats containing protein [Reticulomyxa filosa]|eukprot:ETO07875.1 G-protein beta WD-40 repeats containing protein [Reticulomyxa filosa]
MQDEKTFGEEQIKGIPISQDQSCYSENWLLQTNRPEDIKDFTCLICDKLQTIQWNLIALNMKNFLKNNSNLCPIEPHDCHYSKTKSTQKFFGNLPVMCLKQFEKDVKTLNGIEVTGKIKCDFKGKLKDLQDHLNNNCSLDLAECWFKHFGCDHTCYRQNLNDHLISNIRFHFDLVMRLFLSMKQTIKLHQVYFFYAFDNSSKLIFDMQKLKKDLQSKIENLQQETLKYRSDIETVKKDFNKQLGQYESTIKLLEEKNSKLTSDYQRLIVKKNDQDKAEGEQKDIANNDVSLSSVLSSAHKNNFEVFCSSSKLLRTLIEHKSCVTSIDYSMFDDGQFICSGSNNKTICVWELDSNKLIQSLNEHSSHVYGVKFSSYHYHNHRQNVICSSSNDKTIRFWDFKHNKQLQIFNGHTDSVCGIEFSSFNNGRYLCSGSYDNTIRLWDVEASKSLHVFNGHEKGVWCVDISPLQSNNNNDNKSNIGVIGGNGYTICSGSWDNTIRIWDIETAKQSNVFKGHKNGIRSVKYGLNELVNTILSGSNDKSASLWDIRSGKRIQVFNRHTDIVCAVDYLPFMVKNSSKIADCNVICSGSRDSTIRFWDIRSNKNELHVIKADDNGSDGISCLKFILIKKKDMDNGNEKYGKYCLNLCYGSHKGHIRIWG